MKIVVTGGAGFIGATLCRELLLKRYLVICIDNLSTGRAENIQDLIRRPNFIFINHDITTPLNIAGHIDQIYHLACPASPPAQQADPIKTIDTNVIGTKNVLELAARKNARILFTSTSEVYGDPQYEEQREEYWGNVNPIGPRSCYDEGKRLAECMVTEYAKCRNVDARIARIFNTYGPFMDPDDGRVISNFITQCIRGDHITIYGDGSQTRSFCYVADTVAGLIALMNTPNITTPTPVNIGNPSEFTIREIASVICDLVTPPEGKEPSTIAFHDLPVDDPKRRRPNIKKAETLFQWTPTTDLITGLRQTIPYFQSQLTPSQNTPQD